MSEETEKAVPYEERDSIAIIKLIARPQSQAVRRRENTDRGRRLFRVFETGASAQTIAPSSFSFATSVLVKPASSRTSSVCSPALAGGR